MSRKIILADDHPLFRSALERALRSIFPELALIEAESFDAVRRAAEANSDADLLLLDLKMPGSHGFSALAYLRGAQPALPVVIISATEDENIIRRAMRLGASGYIPKSSAISTIREALEAVVDGALWVPPQVTLEDEDPEGRRRDHRIADLTPQQVRVLMMLSEGLLNKQIAYELGIAEATVKAHMTAILRKLKVSNRTQAVVMARELEIEPSEAADFAGDEESE